MKQRTLFLCLIALSFSIQAQVPSKPLCSSIIPKPLSLSQQEGYNLFDNTTTVFIDAAFGANADYFMHELNSVTSFNLQQSDKGSIQFLLSEQLSHADSYSLKITDNGILIEAANYGGAVYGLQSLKQLIQINNPLFGHRTVFVPKIEIEDQPAFVWRGYMLDVVRHFFSIDDIKVQINQMAALKLNRLHLHLSDDQGYRLEMKRYPKLNSIGSWRMDYNCTNENINAYWGRPIQKEGDYPNYGGYYTREEIKELIAYAKVRNIEILPEIDVPGHAQAIIASYPELACEYCNYTVATGAVRADNTLCPSNKFTYEFMEAVIEEVSTLFPLEYIHIGGDECNKQSWREHKGCQKFIKKNKLENEEELQSYFIRKIEEIINAKGKKMIGWDEILEGGLAPNATVMSWRGEAGGIASSKMGHDVIMSPSNYHYLDFKQGQSDFEPNLGYGQTLLSKCYSYKVIPDTLSASEAKHILGAQGNMWTESISDFGKLTYLLYPRLFAVAENVWTPHNSKNWDDFMQRLKPQLSILERSNVRYAKSVFNPWIHHQGENKGIKVWLSSELSTPEIRYTTDGTNPTVHSLLYKDTLRLNTTTMLKVALFEQGELLGDIISKNYIISKAAGAKVRLLSAEKMTSPQVLDKLTDLTYGQLHQDGDVAWVRFDNDVDIELDFGSPQNINSITIRSMRHTLISMYAAQSIEIYVAQNGEYKKIAETGIINENTIQGRNILEDKVSCKIENATKIRLKIHAMKNIPEGHVNAGSAGHLMLDEIIVE